MGNRLALQRRDPRRHAAEFEARSRDLLASARAMGDQRKVAMRLCSVGIAVHARGDWPAARALFEESVQVARDRGDPHVPGWTLNSLARAECEEGHRGLAQARFAESIVLLRDIGYLGGVAESMEGLATIALAMDSPIRADRLLYIAYALRHDTV